MTSYVKATMKFMKMTMDILPSRKELVHVRDTDPEPVCLDVSHVIPYLQDRSPMHELMVPDCKRRMVEKFNRLFAAAFVREFILSSLNLSTSINIAYIVAYDGTFPSFIMDYDKLLPYQSQLTCVMRAPFCKDFRYRFIEAAMLVSDDLLNIMYAVNVANDEKELAENYMANLRYHEKVVFPHLIGASEPTDTDDSGDCEMTIAYAKLRQVELEAQYHIGIMCQ